MSTASGSSKDHNSDLRCTLPTQNTHSIFKFPNFGMESEDREVSTDATSVTIPGGREKDSGVPENQVPGDDHEYITGIKLVLVLSALTIVYFLVMLDNTILSTVSAFRSCTCLMPSY